MSSFDVFWVIFLIFWVSGIYYVSKNLKRWAGKGRKFVYILAGVLLLPVIIGALFYYIL
jgi:hypothetical protein